MLVKNEPIAEFSGVWKVGTIQTALSILGDSIQHLGTAIIFQIEPCVDAMGLVLLGCTAWFFSSLSSNKAHLECLSLHMSILPSFACPCFGF